MSATHDSTEKLDGYTHPDRLVSTEWLAAHLEDPEVVVVESDEDVLLYRTGHIPGAVHIDWHVDLNDPDVRDYLDGPALPSSWTPVASGGPRRSSCTATRTTGGPRTHCGCSPSSGIPTFISWTADGRSGSPKTAPLTTETPAASTSGYPVIDRDDTSVRIFRDGVLAHLGQPLVDIRSPQEYSGERTSAPEYPEEGVLRRGHIPGADNVPWARAVAPDGTFKPRDELAAIYLDEVGLGPDSNVVTYCRIGERSSHTWFYPDLPARLRSRPQLRRVIDRMGQLGPRTHRPGAREWGAAALTTPGGSAIASQAGAAALGPGRCPAGVGGLHSWSRAW